jgi:hypothetical protein
MAKAANQSQPINLAAENLKKKSPCLAGALG